jgi:hypothetical protein
VAGLVGIPSIADGASRQSRTGQPYQFRTRNDIINTQRTRSNAHETAVKSTKLIDILPLITVWLEVRVLPDPPVNQWLTKSYFRSLHQKRPTSSTFAMP